MQTSLQRVIEDFKLDYKAVYVFDIPNILRSNGIKTQLELQVLVQEGLRSIGVPIIWRDIYHHQITALSSVERSLLETYLYKVTRTIPANLWEKEISVQSTQRAMIFFFI